jgi:hypothetical protein
MPRRSPYRHPVKSHLREGRRVHKYVRGEGSAPRRVIGSHAGGGGYSVTVEGGGRSESFTVQAGGLPEAMSTGLGRATLTPQVVRLRRR